MRLNAITGSSASLMHLTITHTTRYTYDAPVLYGMQQVRLTPKERASQKIIDWTVEADGGTVELQSNSV